jgi:hypothetical protein
MYQVTRRQTSRLAGVNQDWTTWNFDTQNFKTKAEVRDYLGKEYCYCKTTKPMFQDGHNGQVGTIYCYTQKEQGKTVYCQDWVSVYIIRRTPILLTRNLR